MPVILFKMTSRQFIKRQKKKKKKKKSVFKSHKKTEFCILFYKNLNLNCKL